MVVQHDSPAVALERKLLERTARVGVLGLGVERFLIRPLYGRSIDDPLLLTFGLSAVII